MVELFTSRRSKNQVSRLKGADGVWYDQTNGVEHVVLDYFKTLYQSEDGNVQVVSNLFRGCISDTKNASLTWQFTTAEVKDALFSMHPDKSLGEDGFSPGFYQCHWSIVGHDVSNACIQWLWEGHIPTNLNNIVMVLIPKKTEMIGPKFTRIAQGHSSPSFNHG